MELLIRWRYPVAPGTQSEQMVVLELKTIRDRTLSIDKTLQNGLEQTARYAERSNATEAHLIICDERSGQSWDNKIYERTEHCDDREIHIWGV